MIYVFQSTFEFVALLSWEELITFLIMVYILKQENKDDDGTNGRTTELTKIWPTKLSKYGRGAEITPKRGTHTKTRT